MQSRIILVSDDADFFEYFSAKLKLRKSDELYKFSFDETLEKLHSVTSALMVINSEAAQDKTLMLLNILHDVPAIVFFFNEDEDFKIKAYKNGMFDYITPLTSDKEIEAKFIPALNTVTSLTKSKLYREMLVNKNLITKNNEVFLDYESILDKELEKIKQKSEKAVLLAISPNEKTKFLLKPNQIETIILNNIRKNDILMNFAANKYFLLIFDADIESAKKIWEKIRAQLPEDIYAGFANVYNKSRQQLVSEALNKLHESINCNVIEKQQDNNIRYSGENFKFFKQEFNKNIERIISPAFFHIQQKYNGFLFGASIEQSTGAGYGLLTIKDKYSIGKFKISCPGFSKINMDIAYKTNKMDSETKRITIDPEELEAGLLEDILEQFILEFKNEVCNVNS